LLAQLDLGGRTDPDHAEPAGQPRQPLVELVPVPLRLGRLDLLADLLDPGGHLVRAPRAVDDRGVVLVDHDPPGPAQRLDAHRLQLVPELRRDQLGTGEHRDVLQHRLAPVASVEPSSTVMTPVRPTLSIASAISSPIEASCAEMVATCAISSRPATSIALSSRVSLTFCAAASMPRLSPFGFAPAATLRRPSRTIAWASTVAVVVPSPAMSLVLVATSLASCAPRFSYGLPSSTSLAMVTPSLVIVGGPNFCWRTTLRPLGPSVTRTASASAFTPCSSRWRASSEKLRIFAIGIPSFIRNTPPRHPGPGGAGAALSG